MSNTSSLTAEQAIRPADHLHSDDRRGQNRAVALFAGAVVAGVAIAAIGAAISYRSLSGRLLSPVQAASAAFALHGAITLLVHLLHTLPVEPQAPGIQKAARLLLGALTGVLALIALARLQPLMDRYSLLPALAVTTGLFLIELTTPFVAGILTGHAQRHWQRSREEAQASGTLVSDLRVAGAEMRRQVWQQHLAALQNRIGAARADEEHLLDGALQDSQQLRQRLAVRQHRWSASYPFTAEPASPARPAAAPIVTLPSPALRPNGVPSPVTPPATFYVQSGSETFHG